MAKDDPSEQTRKTIDDLREQLFATIDDLRNPDNPMDVERAKAIKGVAAEIIDSAKVDLKYIELTGYGNDSFIGATKQLEGPIRPKR